MYSTQSKIHVSNGRSGVGGGGGGASGSGSGGGSSLARDTVADKTRYNSAANSLIGGACGDGRVQNRGLYRKRQNHQVMQNANAGHDQEHQKKAMAPLVVADTKKSNGCDHSSTANMPNTRHHHNISNNNNNNNNNNNRNNNLSNINKISNNGDNVANVSATLSTSAGPYTLEFLHYMGTQLTNSDGTPYEDETQMQECDNYSHQLADVNGGSGGGQSANMQFLSMPYFMYHQHHHDHYIPNQPQSQQRQQQSYQHHQHHQNQNNHNHNHHQQLYPSSHNSPINSYHASHVGNNNHNNNNTSNSSSNNNNNNNNININNNNINNNATNNNSNNNNYQSHNRNHHPNYKNNKHWNWNGTTKKGFNNTNNNSSNHHQHHHHNQHHHHHHNNNTNNLNTQNMNNHAAAINGNGKYSGINSLNNRHANALATTNSGGTAANSTRNIHRTNYSNQTSRSTTPSPKSDSPPTAAKFPLQSLFPNEMQSLTANGGGYESDSSHSSTAGRQHVSYCTFPDWTPHPILTNLSGTFYGSHQNLSVWNGNGGHTVGDGLHAIGETFYGGTVHDSMIDLHYMAAMECNGGQYTKRRYSSGRNSPTVQKSLRMCSRKFGSGTFGCHNSRAHETQSSLITPPDRFLARSHLVEVKETPKDLLNDSPWDKLSQKVWDKFFVAQQKEGTYKKKIQIWQHLYLSIKKTYPRLSLYLVGSTISGFGADTSDIDMCLVSRISSLTDPRLDALIKLTELQNYLMNSTSIFEQFNLIQAKVPILRFRDLFDHLEVDLNYNNYVGIRNTHLLFCYSRMDWRIQPLVLVIKQWAQFHHINNAKNMTISSYSLVLMVIHFLQCGTSPPVLPCLHSMYPDKFQKMRELHHIEINEKLDPYYSDNKQTLGELFVQFLEYFSKFSYTQHAMSVRTASLLSIDDCRYAKSEKNDPHQWKELCIEEPFDLTNTARSVYDYDMFERIKGVFLTSWRLMRDTKDLDTIFTKPFLNQHPVSGVTVSDNIGTYYKLSPLQNAIDRQHIFNST